jgi:predicted glycoside hydrolase/deacetylase ChbG (UPF0249 family)
VTRPEVAEAVDRLAERLGVAVRSRHPRVRYRGLYGQDRNGRTLPDAIGPDSYVDAIRNLPPGATELGCHPGHPDGLESDYRDERAIELQTLCDPRVRAAVSEVGVHLITWGDLRALGF